MLIAQLSDPHIVPAGERLFRRFDSAEGLRRAVERIGRLRPSPDCVVISGDLVNQGSAAEYANLRDILAPLAIPVCLMPGNHDDRFSLAAAFAGPATPRNLRQEYDGAPLLCRRLDLSAGNDALTLLMLDTLVPGSEAGELGDPHFAWLDAACPADRPAMLFLHHPPFASGIAGMDAIRCAGSERLAHWLARRSNVVALSCGHVHRTIFTRFAGVPATIAPSTAHQIALDLDGDTAALSWTPEPAGFLLHHWQGGRLLTHLVSSAAVEVVRYAD